MAPPPNNDDGPGLRRRWHLRRSWSAVALALVLLLAVSSRLSVDTDFWLPDPYVWMAAWVALVFLASGFVRSRLVRVNLLAALGVVPAVVLLGGEVLLLEGEEDRIQRSDDPVLRYHYRPGHGTRDEGPTGLPLRITELGLWDDARPLAKPANTYRIVLLGDSVPNDPNIPRTSRFHRVLEQQLEGRVPGGMDVEVINVSCEGYNTVQEVRLLELVGLRYDPDLVVLAYVGNDPFIQHGGQRRLGTSRVAFKLLIAVASALEANCDLMANLYDGYAYELTVGVPLHQLAALSQAHGFETLVAVLPMIVPFDDPVCARLYDQVEASARSAGHPVVQVRSAFSGENYESYLKPDEPSDFTHPNADGHARYGAAIADAVVELLERSDEAAQEQPSAGVAEQEEPADEGDGDGDEDGGEPPPR